LKKYVCIDIGGTAIKYGVIAESSDILVKEQMATEADQGGAAILQKATAIVSDYMTKYDISGVCISTAGMVDVEKGEIFYSSPLIPDYTGTQFKKTIQQQCGVPCEIENDVNCAGLAESISGAGAGSRITLCLTIGTGIGGCVVMDGEVYHGYSNSACEVGYMHMFDSDFQTLGAASVLSAKVAERKGALRDEWDGYRIFTEAKKGDAICCEAIDEMVDVLGRGIANICYVLNPQTVVLGGGIMAQEDYLYPRIRAALDKYLVPVIAEKTTLKMAAHKNDAGMLGAFYHFRKRTMKHER
jgi:predicted NBD/HSP70 family sugar kinase